MVIVGFDVVVMFEVDIEIVVVELVGVVDDVICCGVDWGVDGGG